MNLEESLSDPNLEPAPKVEPEFSERPKAGVIISDISRAIFDPVSKEFKESKLNLTLDRDVWLEGQLVLPATEISPVVIVGKHEGSSLKLGYGLKPVQEVLQKGEDEYPFHSLESAIAQYLRPLAEGGVTHIVEQADDTLPNSVLQISLPRRGVALVTYGQSIDIVATMIAERGEPAAVTTLLQGKVEDYSQEAEMYDRLQPTIMWQDETVGMTRVKQLDWRKPDGESTTLPKKNCVVVVNSHKKRYAVLILQEAVINKGPYYWARSMSYKTFPLTFSNEDIFNALFPDTD